MNSPVEISQPKIRKYLSNCCEAEVRYESVDNGWHVEQCQSCYQYCGLSNKLNPNVN